MIEALVPLGGLLVTAAVVWGVVRYMRRHPINRR